MKTLLNDISVEKSNGRFYTPAFIVNNILDMAGYYGMNVLKKHAIDNSCGDGAFLVEMIRRYCFAARNANIPQEEIKTQLGHFIHGIEIDREEYTKCKTNAARAAAAFGIENVLWDIRCGDALEEHCYDGKMHFVLGNPPYIRIHNVGKAIGKVKNFSFAQNGMTDLYLVFYEIGLKMLNNDGVLGYITPSSFFNSVAGERLRSTLIRENLPEKIIDLRHFQPFHATTYTTIVILKRGQKNHSVSYYRFDEKNMIPYFVDELTPEDFCIGGNFYFASKKELHLLRNILYNSSSCGLSVKNGFATLCDSVFIGDFAFNSKYLLPVVKASTGQKKRIFYPYDQNARLIAENELQKDETLYRYLLRNKELLLTRSSERSANSAWYSFGRSQAIRDTYKYKIGINTLLRTADDIKLNPAPAGCGVYSGLYIAGDSLSMSTLERALRSDDFNAYISLLGKYKSGGYYTFSSKDLTAFLNYKLGNEGGSLS